MLAPAPRIELAWLDFNGSGSADGSERLSRDSFTRMKARSAVFVAAVLASVLFAFSTVSAEPKQPSALALPKGSPTAPPVAPATPQSNDPCDRDSDGVRALSCGGSDCDDHDRFTYPGNPELCAGTLPDGRSAADHDEDCNPCTVAGLSPDGDDDHDGFVAGRCRNHVRSPGAPIGCDLRNVGYDATSGWVLAKDCDDTNMAVVPNAQICADAHNVRICSSMVAGSFVLASCPAGTTCLAQPNSLGVCGH